VTILNMESKNGDKSYSLAEFELTGISFYVLLVCKACFCFVLSASFECWIKLLGQALPRTVTIPIPHVDVSTNGIDAKEIVV
jgi:hypothetical protein